SSDVCSSDLGWISLVHYNRDAIGDAAPMHGLGYYDLPQDLMPTGLALAEQQLYVTAKGYNFPRLDTTYEGQVWLLVYQREDRLPGSGAIQSKDRDILFSLPLPLTQAPRALAVVDDLLFVDAEKEGIAVISLADPLKPTVVRVLKNALFDGVRKDFAVRDMAARNGVLYVTADPGSRQGLFNLMFDLTKPSLPQLGSQRLTQNDVDGTLATLAAEQTLALGGAGLSLIDTSNPNLARVTGRYVDNGFPLPGVSAGLEASGTLVAQIRQQEC